MYALYYSPGRASMAVHWMLLELGVPFEARLVDFAIQAHKDSEYLRLNPDGMIPTLIVDGEPHFESAALALLLAERHPEGRLNIRPGAPERPAYLQWMLYLANTLQPLYRAWFYTNEVGGAQSAEAVKAHASVGIEKVWGRIDSRLRAVPYLAGGMLSAVDFHATMLMRWSREMPRSADRWGAISAYLDRMKKLKSFALVHEREGLDIWPSAHRVPSNNGRASPL
jgi:glutathione S-transferase